MEQDMRAFYWKYNIYRREADGTNGPLITGPTFTIRPYDPHGRVALRAYAVSVEESNPELARDLRRLCDEAESGDDLG